MRGLDWALRRGEHWGVFGCNGAGKSTFLRVLRGDMPPDLGGKRTYCLDGEPVGSPLGLRQRIGFVSPELHSRYMRQAWKVNGLEVILAGFFDTQLLYEKPTPAQIRAAEELLDELGASWLAGCALCRMSTGELRTVLLARALVVRPDVLVLDECMEGLDAAAVPGMLAAIERAASMTTIVCAAHRLDQVPAVVGKSMLLRDGEMVCGGDAGELRERIGKELFSQTTADVPSVRLAEFPKPFSESPTTPTTPETAGAPGGDCLVRLTNADVVLEGTRILENINWEIRDGECWAVVGRNGAGKSSLLRVLCAELPVHLGGEVRWFEQEGLPNVVDVRRKIGLVSDRLQSLYEYDLTVHELVLSGFFSSIGLYEEASEEQHQAVTDILHSMGLEELASRSMYSLSYGQLRRAFIARALVSGNRLLLLDEPLSGLDPASRRDIRALLSELSRAGYTLVYVTHHQDEFPPEFDRLLVLDKGRIVYKGLRSAYSGD